MSRAVFLLPLLLLLTACLSLPFTKDKGPAPVAIYGAGEGAGSTGIHSVLPGENLYTIAKRYNLPLQDIALVNRLHAPFALPPGTRLKLPPPREYKAKAGDSLSSIARLFNASPSQLARLNRLSAPYAIKAGMVVRLPPPQKEAPPPPPQTRLVAPAAPLSPPPTGAFDGVLDRSLHSGQPATQLKSASPPASAAQIALQPIPPRVAGKFLQPVGGKIVSGYGPKAGGLFNDGINIAAPKGAPVRAAENGVVVFAGDGLKGFGNLVLVRHEDRWISAYGHLGRILVKRGQVLKRGESLGTVGTSGAVDTPQLHFELRRGTEPLNPVPYLHG
ncbi:MAG: LysM peptidoglycan-binding domain-containing M23 family metallopeptidase [Alphaproteobacteria bacterium]|nr:LysM peptidoglycan-binding domain-containing M23 family metallopeptidase [Alphaproteobacteria bacterium]